MPLGALLPVYSIDEVARISSVIIWQLMIGKGRARSVSWDEHVCAEPGLGVPICSSDLHVFWVIPCSPIGRWDGNSFALVLQLSIRIEARHQPRTHSWSLVQLSK
jgi:hypothetical protein